MERKNWLVCWLAALACVSVSVAHANIVYLEPSSVTVNPGDGVQFELWMDFSDPVVTGGVDVTYTGLDYGGFTWNTAAGLPWDDLWGVKALNELLGETEVRVGNFFNAFSGNLLLGIFDFTLSPDATMGEVALMAPADPSGNLLLGQQWTAKDYKTIVPVDFSGGAQVFAAVPEPATFWLMFIGLGAMVAIGAMRSTQWRTAFRPASGA